MEPPTGEWVEAATPPDAPDLSGSPFPDLEPVILQGVVRHTFTHFHLVLSVAAIPNATAVEAPVGAEWRPLESLGDLALPTVMRKVVGHALSAAPLGAR